MLLIKFLKNKFLVNKDPAGSTLLLAIKSILVSILAIIFLYFTKWPQGFWLVIPAILFMLSSKGNNNKSRLLMMLVVAACTMLGVFVATIAGNNMLHLMLIVFISAFIATYVNQRDKNIKIGSSLTLSMILFAAGMPNTLPNAGYRITNIGIALLIAIVMTFVIFPVNNRKRLRRNLARAIRDIGDYYYHIVADSLRGNHQQTYHRTIRNKIIHFMSINRSLVNNCLLNTPEDKTLALFFQTEERLLEIISALANILTSPRSSTAFTNILHHIHHFSRITRQLFQQWFACLRHHTNIPELTEFDSNFTSLTTRINIQLKILIERSDVYELPIDLANFIYALNHLNTEIHQLQNILIKIEGANENATE